MTFDCKIGIASAGWKVAAGGANHASYSRTTSELDAGMGLAAGTCSVLEHAAGAIESAARTVTTAKRVRYNMCSHFKREASVLCRFRGGTHVAHRIGPGNHRFRFQR